MDRWKVRIGAAVVALLVPILIGDPIHGQSSADSVAVVEVMLEHWLTAENASHYLGEPPYSPYHPGGQPGAFCVVLAEGDGGSGRALEDPDLLAAVRDRILPAFRMRYIDECRLRRDEEGRAQGFYDAEDVPVVQVRIGALLKSSSVGWAYFGLDAGAWPGRMGWRCAVRRDDASRWILVEGECRYYES